MPKSLKLEEIAMVAHGMSRTVNTSTKRTLTVQLKFRLPFFRHPDKNPDSVHDAKVQFQKITAAYNRLTSDGHLPDEDSDEDGDFGWDSDEEAYYQAEDHFCNIWCVLIQTSICLHMLQCNTTSLLD